MPKGGRMPKDDQPASYCGPTQVASCGSCGRVAHIGTYGRGLPVEGHCTGCERLVWWS